jgi:hypothetical protein
MKSRIADMFIIAIILLGLLALVAVLLVPILLLVSLYVVLSGILPEDLTARMRTPTC